MVVVVMVVVVVVAEAVAMMTTMPASAHHPLSLPAGAGAWRENRAFGGQDGRPGQPSARSLQHHRRRACIAFLLPLVVSPLGSFSLSLAS